MTSGTLRYQSSPDGPWMTLEFPEERLDEILARADTEFLPPWTAEDERKFRAIMKSSEELRNAKAKR